MMGNKVCKNKLLLLFYFFTLLINSVNYVHQICSDLSLCCRQVKVFSGYFLNENVFIEMYGKCTVTDLVDFRNILFKNFGEK